MTAVPILIADAIASEINSGVDDDAFVIGGFVAKRSYADWDDTFSDLSDMVVDVVFVTSQPAGTVALSSRGFIEYDTMVDIAIRKRFVTSDRDPQTGRLKHESVDPLVTLLQQLHEHFVAQRNTVPLTDVMEANWTESDVKSWVNQRRLRMGLFEAAVRITFNTRKMI